jgi:hypothetical protein
MPTYKASRVVQSGPTLSRKVYGWYGPLREEGKMTLATRIRREGMAFPAAESLSLAAGPCGDGLPAGRGQSPREHVGSKFVLVSGPPRGFLAPSNVQRSVHNVPSSG